MPLVNFAGRFDVTLGSGPSVEPARKYWRVLHDYEIWKKQFVYPGHGQFYHEEGWDWRKGMPEVFWLLGTHVVPFDERWQTLAYAMNPGMGGEQFRVLYDDHRAFMNRTGFWTDPTHFQEYVPHDDYVNMIDLGTSLPKWDKIRVCGGATLSGTVDGDTLIVETLKYGTCPSWAWLEQYPWLYFHALSVGGTSSNPKAVAFPQNNGNRVLIPLVADGEVRFPLGALEEVNAIADPYEVKL